MLFRSPLKVASLLLISASTSQAAEVKLPQATIDKINQDFLDSYEIELYCSQNVASPKFTFFAAGEYVYLLRDSNSNWGTSVAKLSQVEYGKYIHEEGMAFQDNELLPTTDIWISSETLSKGEGELSAVLYGDLYKCDAKISTLIVQDVVNAISIESAKLVKAQKPKRTESKSLSVNSEAVARVIHDQAIPLFDPQPVFANSPEAVFNVTFSGKFGAVTNVKKHSSSGDWYFDYHAELALKSLTNIQNFFRDVKPLLNGITDDVTVAVPINGSKVFRPSQ